MARTWRALRVVLVVLLVLAVLAAGFGTWTVRRSFPQTSGEASLPALEGQVTVHRDDWGVPHIYGDTVRDLVRAQGYVQAQDRFWEMDVRRHITAGRLSELFGPDQVETDRFIRTLGWRRVAEAELELLDDRSIEALEAYAEGVNAYLEDRSPAELSLEYAVLSLTNRGYEVEPWTPIDSLAWLKAMAWELRSNSKVEIERSVLSASMSHDRIDEMYPSYPFDRFDPIITGGDVSAAAAEVLETADVAATGIGSNSWAVSGDHTPSGAAIIANDPHLSPSQPGIWHQVGLHCTELSDACPLDVSGFSFAGVPGVVVGHNHRIAWAVTNLGADVADHYVERVDGDRYEVDGEWRDMDVRTETISVAGGDDVEVRIRTTRHGPVVSDASAQRREVLESADIPGLGTVGEEGHAMTLQWTALAPGRTFDALYGLNVAEDFDDFRAAARLFDVPAQNLLYADVDGHIGYQAPGRHPIRAPEHDGRWPAAGWTTATDWQGFIPFDDLPSVLDPEEGYLATANEAVVGPEFRYAFPGNWAPGFRAERIDELLQEVLADGTATAEELGAMHLDNRMLLADILLEPLFAVEVDGHTATARQLLDGWDGQMDPDSNAAAYFGAVVREVLLRTFGDELPSEVPTSDRGRLWLALDDLLEQPDDPWWDDLSTDGVEDRDELLRASLEAADDVLTERFGPDTDTWSWGAMHTLTAEHGTLGQSGIGPIEALFNRGPYEAGGGGSVVNANGWDPDQGFEVNWVPSMRMVVDLGNPDDARWINLTGVSGHAFHPHYDDMSPLWAAGETVPWFATRSAVEEAAVDTLVLAP